MTTTTVFPVFEDLAFESQDTTLIDSRIFGEWCTGQEQPHVSKAITKQNKAGANLWKRVWRFTKQIAFAVVGKSTRRRTRIRRYRSFAVQIYDH